MGSVEWTWHLNESPPASFTLENMPSSGNGPTQQNVPSPNRTKMICANVLAGLLPFTTCSKSNAGQLVDQLVEEQKPTSTMVLCERTLLASKRGR